MFLGTKMKKYKVGILGAGQLGALLAQSCIQKNISWCLFYESQEEPGFLLYKNNSIQLKSNPFERKLQLEECEVILLESEFYSYEELKEVNSKFIPSIESYKNFYGKIAQRNFYHSLGINGPQFWIAQKNSDLEKINQFPVIMKRNLFSYDGNGNRECKNSNDLKKYSEELEFPILIEEKLKIKSEFAVGIVFSKNKSLTFPLVETYQKNHICHYVISPFELPQNLKEKLEGEIEKLKSAFLFGLFAFEFFITEDGEIVINEGAARPHNSLHITMDLCTHSQFDYIVDLAVNDDEIKSYKMKAPLGAMINLLGRKESINPSLSLPQMPSDLPYRVYLYGKKQGRIGRKLGHLNLLNTHLNQKEFILLLDKIYEGYDI